MAKTKTTSVEEYFAAQPEEARAALERVRSTIRKAVPDAKEEISYQIPTYKLPGGPMLYFAGWKQHFSLYPASASLIAALAGDLEAYVISKGTIRFPLSEPVPVKLIERIAKFRAKEVVEEAKAKEGAKKVAAAKKGAAAVKKVAAVKKGAAAAKKVAAAVKKVAAVKKGAAAANKGAAAVKKGAAVKKAASTRKTASTKKRTA